MAVAVVQTKAVNGTSPITVTLDSSPTAGNVLVMFAGSEGTSAIQPNPSGDWVGVSGTTDPGGANPASVSFRVVLPGDPSAWTFAGTAGTDSRVYLVEFSGQPTPSAEGSSDSTNGTAATTASVTLDGPGLLVAASVFSTAGAPATPLAGSTEQNEAAITGTTLTLWVGYRSVGAGTFTLGHTMGSADFAIASLPIIEEALPGRIDWDADLVSWTISRGSGAEITSPANPGSATLVLKNSIAAGAASDDLYNPYNASGPNYGNLADGLPVWVGVNGDGSMTSPDHGLFGGRVTDITLMPSEGTSVSPLVEIVCEDALGWYPRVPIQIDYAEGRSQGAFRAEALANGNESRTDLASEITTMPLSHADGSLGSVLDAINAANGTRHFIKPADVAVDWYTYTTRNRQWRMDATSDAALDAGSDHVTGTSGWRLSADTVINQQTATVTPVSFTPETFTVWQADPLPIDLDDTHPYHVTVSFDSYVSGAAINIASTGDPVVSVFTPFATGGVVDLSVDPGDAATVTQLSIKGSLAKFAPAESYVANDLTSQGQPRGVRAGSEIGNEYVGTLASARGFADHVVLRYGNPQLRPTLTVTNWFPDMFELDLYDVISFTSSQLGMTDYLFEIVGLTLEGHIAADTVKHHVVTYVLQESRYQTDPGWFILDTSELDGPDILAA